MKILMFEGTPQEMKELKGLGIFTFNESNQVSNREPFSEAGEELSNKELTEGAVISMLTRNGGMTHAQTTVVKAIYEHGLEGITSVEISKQTKLAQSRVKATMRTIGKRVAHTKDWPQGIRAFEQVWTGIQNIYRLHPIMRKVIDSGAVSL